MSKYRITVEGKTYEMDVELIGANGAVVAPVAKAAAPVVTAPKAAPAPVAAKPAEVGSGSVVAPMPGTILKVLKATGDAVKAGEVVLILEAMKMENEIQAETDGTVTSIEVKVGDSVLEGVTLLKLG